MNKKFHPKYVIADAGYSSEEFRRLVRRQYSAEPIIKPNPAHKKAVRAYPETAEFQRLYSLCNRAERVFSRLKGHRKLNSIRVRGIRKVTVHCLTSVIVLQAQALATGSRVLVRGVAQVMGAFL
jgi:hypothetical protein